MQTSTHTCHSSAYPQNNPLSSETFNKNESFFSCPLFSRCVTFNSMQECELEKAKSPTLTQCVQTVLQRTVEYVKECTQHMQQICREKPNTLYYFCLGQSRSVRDEKDCNYNHRNFDRICTSKPIIKCNEYPTGKFIDGPQTIQGIHQSEKSLHSTLTVAAIAIPLMIMVYISNIKNDPPITKAKQQKPVIKKAK